MKIENSPQYEDGDIARPFPAALQAAGKGNFLLVGSGKIRNFYEPAIDFLFVICYNHMVYDI